MKQKIIGGAVLILVLVGLFWLGSRGQAKAPTAIENSQPSAKLEVNETKYDFGAISMARGPVSRRFTVKNNSTEAVTLESLTTSCMCTNAYFENGSERRGPFGMVGHGGAVPKLNETILPGATVTVEAVFDPAAHGPAGVGQIERQIFLRDSAGGSVVFDIKALVTS
ncbi:MAG: DUF1573 domain-containing protein [Patescibacteria group bacterium]